MDSLANSTLPTIHFTPENSEPGSDSWASTSKDVVRALEEYGCFFATYSKFSLDLHQAIFGAAKEMFDLPTEVKVLNTSNKPSHGYLGQQPVIPLYESLGIENAVNLEGVNRFTNLLWPSGNTLFSETSLEFSMIMAELDELVVSMVFDGYGINKSNKSFLGSKYYLLRLLKYRAPGNDEAHLGIIPHTDKSFMSIVHQHQVKGLEIKTKNGEWMLIDPSPSTFVFMAGDACMAWSNGRIEPTLHRVKVKGSKDRYSLGFFTFIKDLTIEVPDELVDEEHPLQFKSFDHYDYVDFYHTDEGRKSICPIKAYCGL